VTCQPCSICAISGLSEVGETATLCELIRDLQSTLAQATRGIAVLVNGLGVIVLLYWRLHPLSAPSPTLFQCRQCWHLDTQPRVNQVMKLAVDAWIINVHGRWICAAPVVRSGNRPTKVTSREWSWPPGVQYAIMSFGASGHIQPTATSANVQSDVTSGPGLPNRQGPQPTPSLGLLRQYLPHPCQFVLLGPDGDPVIGATVGLRPNTHWSSI